MTKQRIYANVGIGLYVIINLVDRVVEVYTRPLAGTGRYGQKVTLTTGESIELPGSRGKRLVVPVRGLLPPHG